MSLKKIFDPILENKQQIIQYVGGVSLGYCIGFGVHEFIHNKNQWKNVLDRKMKNFKVVSVMKNKNLSNNEGKTRMKKRNITNKTAAKEIPHFSENANHSNDLAYNGLEKQSIPEYIPPKNKDEIGSGWTTYLDERYNENKIQKDKSKNMKKVQADTSKTKQKSELSDNTIENKEHSLEIISNEDESEEIDAVITRSMSLLAKKKEKSKGVESKPSKATRSKKEDESKKEK